MLALRKPIIMDQTKIANFLADLRKEKNLTQNDVAQLLNISPQAVSKWERGESLPDIQTLIYISKLYSVSIDEILAGERKAVVAPVVDTSNGTVNTKPKRETKYYIAPIVGASFGVLMLLLFLWIKVNVGSAEVLVNGSYYVVSVIQNLYQVVFGANDYSIGNVFFLFIFLVNLALIIVSGVMFAPLTLKTEKRMNITQNVLASVQGVLFLLSALALGEYVNFGFYFNFAVVILAIIAFWIIGVKIYGKKKNKVKATK